MEVMAGLVDQEMGRENEIIRLMRDISLSDDPKKTLIDMKTILIDFPSNVPQHLFENIDLHVLFDSINSSDNEQINLCVDILNLLIPMVGAEVALERHLDQVMRCLVHPSEKVRSFILQQIPVCAESSIKLTILLANKHLILATIAALGDKSLAVVKVATEAIIAICRYKNGVHSIFSSDGTLFMQEVMSKSDTCRFNVYEVIVKVSLLSDENLAIVSNSGLLDRLIGEVLKGDVLTQLNALEMLTNLALNPGGLTLLQDGGVISKLQYLLSLSETDPMAILLMPGLVKFFGNLGHVQPWQLAGNYTSVLTTVMNQASGAAEHCDPSLQIVAIETVAHIAYSPEGKYALMKFESEMQKLFTHLSSKLRTAPTEQRARVIDALSQLFHLEQESQTEELLNILEQWWGFLNGGPSIEKLAAMARQPFPDLHCSSLGLLNELANLPWGQKLIATEPGFLEYLMDRSTESEKTGLEAKFDVVVTLVSSSTAKSILGDVAMDKLEQHQRQGPYYAPSQAQVAFERDT